MLRLTWWALTKTGMWACHVTCATRGGSQNGGSGAECCSILQQEPIGWGFPSLNQLPGDHPCVPTDRMSCNVCPLLPVATEVVHAGWTLSVVSVGLTAVAPSVGTGT